MGPFVELVYRLNRRRNENAEVRLRDASDGVW